MGNGSQKRKKKECRNLNLTFHKRWAFSLVTSCRILLQRQRKRNEASRNQTKKRVYPSEQDAWLEWITGECISWLTPYLNLWYVLLFAFVVAGLISASISFLFPFCYGERNNNFRWMFFFFFLQKNKKVSNQESHKHSELQPTYLSASAYLYGEIRSKPPLASSCVALQPTCSRRAECASTFASWGAVSHVSKRSRGCDRASTLHFVFP